MNVIRLLLAIAIVIFVPIATATAAHATITGPCTASGTIAGAVYPASRATAVIPRTGAVHWQGAINTGAINTGAGKRQIEGRKIEGKVYIKLPPPIGKVEIGSGSWDGSSNRYRNQGTYRYDLPVIFEGPRITLFGHHSERGTVVCTGTIEVRIGGSRLKNPVFLGSLVLTVLAAWNMLFVARAKGARL